MTYLLLLIHGIAISDDFSTNFLAANDVTHILHLLIAVGMILLGILLGCRRSTPEAGGSPPGERRLAAHAETDLSPIIGDSRLQSTTSLLTTGA